MTTGQDAALPVLTELLFEEPGVGRCLVAPDGSVIRANAEWLRSTGFTHDEVVGSDIISLFPGTRDMALAMHARARAGHRVAVPRHGQVVNGRETWWEGSIAPVPMQGGTGLLIVAREVTAEVARGKGDDESAAATTISDPMGERLRELAEHVPAAMFVKDSGGRYLFANRWVSELFGLTPENIIGRTAGDIMPADVAERTRRLEQRLRSEPEVTTEDIVPTPHGERVLLTVRFPLLITPGEVGTCGFAIDITDRRRAEEAQRRTDALIGALATNVRDQVVVLEPVRDTGGDIVDWRYVHANDGAAELLGVKHRDLVGNTLRSVLGDRGAASMERLERVLKTGARERYEVAFRERLLLVTVFRVDASTVASASIDVTELRHAERALRESEARLRRLSDSGMIGVLHFDLTGAITDANDRFLSMVGYAREDLEAGRVAWDRMTPAEYRAADERAIAELKNAGVDTPYEKEYIRKDGSRVPILIGAATYDTERQRGVAFVLDTSEQKRAEAERREVEARARARATELEVVLDTVPAAVWIAHDRDGDVITANRFGTELLRAPVRSNVSLTAAPDERPTNFRVLKNGVELAPDELPIQAAARFGKSFHDVELEVAFDDGTVRHILGNSTPLRDASGDPRGSVGAFIDITERKLAEVRAASLARFPEENPDPVLRLDRDLAVLYANDAARARLAALGVETGTRAPAPLADFAREALRTGSRIKGEVTAGEAVFSVNVVPVSDEVNVYAQDITARRAADEALRASEAKYRNLFENMTEEVHLWELVRDGERIVTWRLVDVNPPTLQTWGRRSLDEIRGKTTDEIFGPGATEHYLPIVQKVMSQRAPHSYEDYFPHLDKHFRFTTIPLGDRFFFTTGSDVTSVKKAQAITERHNEELREAARRKDEFLAMLSHELRNPLAPIRNSIYILRRAKAGAEQAERAQAVIERQTEHLTRLVDDLLDVTRIARGRIELRRARVDLRDVVSRAAEDFRLVMRERAVAFHVTLPAESVWADADATRVTQIVGNLVHNASKFTRGGDTVAVSLEVVSGMAEIRVRDTGAGIDPALLPSIFDPFVQGDRTLARTEGGLGLGLALAKGIADLHGGTVHAESAGKGMGANFVVRLPVVPGGAGVKPGVVEGVSCDGGRRVLIVDDNVDAAESLAEIVRMLGHTAEVAFDGPSALEKARARPPDVVLCDLGLPGMSGYDVARALRAAGPASPRLVAVSGYAQPDDVRRAQEAGFDGHIPKPADPSQIERLLAT